MSIIQSFINLFRSQDPEQETKSADIVSILRYAIGSPAGVAEDFTSIVTNAYSADPVIYACVRHICRSTAAVPWIVSSPRGSHHESDYSPASELGLEGQKLINILRRPNPNQSRSELMHALVCDLLLAGDAFLELVGPDDPNAPPQEMYLLRPDRVKVIESNQLHGVSGYEYEGRKYRPDQIIHLQEFDPLRGVGGISPVRSILKRVALSTAAWDYTSAMIQNGASPEGLLVLPGEHPQETLDRVQETLKAKYSGKKRAGTPMVLANGMTWQQTGSTPKDMAWSTLVQLSTREKATALGVPPELIGDSSNKTYSNYETAERAYYSDTVIPYLNYIQGELSRGLAPRFDSSLSLAPDIDSISAIREDTIPLWTATNAAYAGGLITRQEARERLGLPAEADGQFKEDN